MLGPKAQQIEELNHIRVTQSLQGIPLPIVFGTQRVPGLLVWYGDFAAKKHKAGGKGLGSKGGGTYTYSASWIAALCSGTIFNVRAVWDQSGAYVPQNAIATMTIMGVGPHVISGYSGTLAGTGGITVGGVPLIRDPWDGTGSPPVPPTPGHYVVNPFTGQLYFSSAQVGETVSIAYSYWSNGRVTQESYLVPGSGSVTVDHAGIAPDSKQIWQQDLGVFDATTGAPIIGYSVSNGVYTGLPVGTLVVIRYVFYLYQTDQYAPGSLSFTVFNGLPSQAVWSYLTAQHPDYAVSYGETAYIAFEDSYLGASGAMPAYSFEVQGRNNIGYGPSGIVDDSPPIDDFYDILTDPYIGIGYPASAIDDATWYTNADSASYYSLAAQLFISQAIANQETVASVCGRWLEACQIAAFCSEGVLKLKPFADQVITSAFATYTPTITPLYNFTDDDFLPPGESADDPVKLTRVPWQDAYNRVQINFTSRLNGYNSDLVYANDEASIERFGFRPEPPQQYDFITGIQMAAAVASLRVKRLTGIRNKFNFRLPLRFEYLEPMDIITITDTALGLNQLPVRIISIDNDVKNGLTVTVEEFPGGGCGVPTPLLNNQTTPPGNNLYSSQALGKTEAIIVQAPYTNAGKIGTRFYIFCMGEDANWAGCVVWVSLDGTNYSQVAMVSSPARLGSLSAAFAAITPAPSGPYGLTFDSAHTLSLDFGINAMNPAHVTATATPGNPTGLWDSSYSYVLGDAALFDNDLWVVVQPSVNQLPTSTSPFWRLISTAQPGGVELQSVADTSATNLASLSALMKIDPIDHKTPTQLELLCYRDVTAGATPNTYDLKNNYRGAYGTKIWGFDIGDLFARFDQASAIYDAPSGLDGSTIHFRFTAWNAVTGSVQDLSMADDYEVKVTNTPGTGIDMGAGAAAVNTQSGSTYTIKNSDFDTLVTLTYSGPVVVKLPDGTTLRQGFYCPIQNSTGSTVTINPTAPQLIDGASTLVLQSGQGVTIYFDLASSNWFTQRGGAGVAVPGVNPQTGTTYTIIASDNQKLVTFSNSSPVTVDLTAPSTLGAQFFCLVENRGAGAVTLTPLAGLIDGASSFVLQQNQGIALYSNGANFYTERGAGGGFIPAGVNPQSGTSYTVLTTDLAQLVTFNNSSPVAVAISPAPTLGSHFYCFLENLGAGLVTITPYLTETIDGAVTLTLNQNQGIVLFSDGSNLFTQRGMGGGAAPRTSVTKTTASLANNAVENSTVAIAKTFTLEKIVADRACRIRLYSTAGLRSADASRLPQNPPITGTQHGVILDLLLNSVTGLTWVLSPVAVGANLESSPSANIPYAIQNLSGAPSTVAVTFTWITEET